MLAAGAGAFVLLRSDEAPPRPKPSPSPIPPFAFTANAVEFVPVDKSGAPGDAEAVSAAVTEMMSDLYDAGFVTAKRWEGGRFSAVLTHFDEKARAQAEADLANLTLGPEARSLKLVTAGPSSLDMSFLVAKDRPVAAVVEATFTGTGELRRGGQLAIAHGGTYYLELIEGAWRITGYRVHGTIDTATASPAAGPTP